MNSLGYIGGNKEWTDRQVNSLDYIGGNKEWTNRQAIGSEKPGSYRSEETRNGRIDRQLVLNTL